MNCFKKKDYKKHDDEPSKKSTTEFTFYDQYGILRKGVTTDDGLLHNRDEELERILKLENAHAQFSDEEKRTWYIVESGWIRTWLSYVRYGTASLGESLSSPAPPPINNECMLLMTANIEVVEEDGFPSFLWVVKNGLKPAGKDGQGHFRRVNCKVWEAFCDMYKGSGPAIKYIEEEVVAPPEPSEPETKEGEAKPGDEEKKMEDKVAKVGEKKEEEKGKEGEAKEGEEEAAQPAGEDPTRWHNTSFWILDQDQQRFREKFGEKRYPHKSKEQRLTLMKDAWNAKKLRGEAKEAEAAEAEAEKKEEEEAKEEGETKEDGDEEEGDEEEGEDKKEEFVEDLLGPASNEEAVSAAMRESAVVEAREAGDVVRGLPQTESFTDGKDRKQSIQVNMDDVFFRAPSQEALEETSRLAQSRTEAMRNANNTAAPTHAPEPTPAPESTPVAPPTPPQEPVAAPSDTSPVAENN